MESPLRREQSKDGGMGELVWLGPGVERTPPEVVSERERGSWEEGSFRPGGRPRSGGMSRVSLMLERRRRISRSVE